MLLLSPGCGSELPRTAECPVVHGEHLTRTLSEPGGVSFTLVGERNGDVAGFYVRTPGATTTLARTAGCAATWSSRHSPAGKPNAARVAGDGSSCLKKNYDEDEDDKQCSDSDVHGAPFLVVTCPIGSSGGRH